MASDKSYVYLYVKSLLIWEIKASSQSFEIDILCAKEENCGLLKKVAVEPSATRKRYFDGVRRESKDSLKLWNTASRASGLSLALC